MMNTSEKIHSVATNIAFIVPITMAITAGWLIFQKSKIQHSAKNIVMNNSYLMRNVAFVGVVTLLLVYFNKPLPSLEESINVRPADF